MIRAVVFVGVLATSAMGFVPVTTAPAGSIQVERYASGALKSVTPTASGVRHGVVRTWYASGQIESDLVYWHGEKAGHQRTWWPNGNLRTDGTFEDGALSGEYRTYYQTGAPYELRHYVNGHESGRQQSWSADGHYDVRNGRRYGMVNALPCIEVSEQGK
jgi:antitoxin component YwqK of YwqJK toxin-antitoxin module